MDAEISKMTQKLLSKQGMKFKLNTKVTKGDDSGETIKINVEAAKGGKEELVCPSTLYLLFLSLTRDTSLMPMLFLLLLAGNLTPPA